MSATIVRIAALAVLSSALFPAIAAAQYGSSWEYAMRIQPAPAKDTLSAVGMVSVKRPPAAIRMGVELQGKGKTLEAALADLKTRREAAVAQLDKLKADKDSVKHGKPDISRAHAAMRQQLERRMSERMSSRGKKAPKGLKVPELVVVAASLTAQWPLVAETPEEMLLAGNAIVEKVKAADLAGAKDAEKLSPEEQEIAEEMMGMSGRGEEPLSVGQPNFVYVAAISEKDRRQALAEAFGKAKAQAAELAQAAGVQLGPLVSLSGNGGGVNDISGDDYPGEYGMRQYRRQMMTQQFGNDDGPLGGRESLGTDPHSLKFGFIVHAVFALGK
jgi:uncharacterized protein YggE